VAVLTADGGLATRKLPSTRANYADAVIDGITGLLAELASPLEALEEVLHGCTEEQIIDLLREQEDGAGPRGPAR
jgi:N-methylhydantoinase A